MVPNQFILEYIMELKIGQSVMIKSTGSKGTVYKLSDTDHVIIRVGRFATMFFTVSIDNIEV